MAQPNKKRLPIPDHVPAERIFDFDVYEDSIKGNDVQSAHMALHKQAPDVFYTPRNGGHWMATRYADVRQIMMNADTFSSRDAFFSPELSRFKISLPPQDMDAPEHMRYRFLLMKFLSPKQVVQLEPQIRALMNSLIDNVLNQRECNFVAAIAVPLPVKTFMNMMGMDLARYAKFVKWANGILGSETLFQRLPHFLRMTWYLKGLIRQRKKKPGDDPISMLLAAEIDGERLSEKRVLEMCNLLFLAGLDTVTNAMTFMTKHLAENADQQQRLRDNPEQIPAAIEEFMRRYAFVNVPRRVAHDTELDGVSLRKGDIIISSLSAASGDERNVEHPEKVDLDRPKSPHLAFNTGPHNCAGAHMARLELRIFLEVWLARVPTFSLAPGYQPRARGGPVMALERLDLCW
ncbi:MAG: cytochrome P450 [Spongiibacteraceae bacterium]